MNDDSLVSSDVIKVAADAALTFAAALTEAARRHQVMVTISVTPYDAEVVGTEVVDTEVDTEVAGG